MSLHEAEISQTQRIAGYLPSCLIFLELLPTERQ